MSKHKEAYHAFAEQLQERLGDALQQLILYGSVAREAERETSDVDVFVVVEKEADEEIVYDVAAAVGRDYGVHIAAIVRTADEYERTKDTDFTRDVVKTGVATV